MKPSRAGAFTESFRHFLENEFFPPLLPIQISNSDGAADPLPSAHSNRIQNPHNLKHKMSRMPSLTFAFLLVIFLVAVHTHATETYASENNIAESMGMS